MISDNLNSAIPKSISGTLADYSEDLYRHYIEVSDHSGSVRNLLLGYLGHERSAHLREVKNGYELDVPIQCVPELVRLLTSDNIAVYQIARLTQSEG